MFAQQNTSAHAPSIALLEEGRVRPAAAGFRSAEVSCSWQVNYCEAFYRVTSGSHLCKMEITLQPPNPSDDSDDDQGGKKPERRNNGRRQSPPPIPNRSGSTTGSKP